MDNDNTEREQDGDMNKGVRIAIKAYLIAGAFYLVATYLNAFNFWVSATRHGLLTGTYMVTIYTNGFGENYYELGLFVVFLPFAIWILAKTFLEMWQARPTKVNSEKTPP